jgi:hypothetical protein
MQQPLLLGWPCLASLLWQTHWFNVLSSQHPLPVSSDVSLLFKYIYLSNLKLILIINLVTEGVYLYNNKVPPYDGGVFHQVQHG